MAIIKYREKPSGEWQELLAIKGDPGAPGYTPVKTVDYWTPEDIAEIKSYIDTAVASAIAEVENGTY